MKKIFPISLLFCIAVIAGCAGRTDVIVLDDRLAAVEGQLARQKALIDQVGQSSDNKEQSIRGQAANFRIEIESLREQIGAINGRLEEIEYRSKQDATATGGTAAPGATELDRVKEETRTLNSRVTQVEQYLGMGGDAKAPDVKATPAKAPAAGAVPLASLSEQDLYDQAKQAFDAGELQKAREGFQEYTKRYPNAKNADNAQFWIGEIYYREKWYEKAIVEYQKVVENYPKGNKVGSAMLKQGYAFLNIGDKANARIILKDLIAKYPNSTEAQLATQKLTQIK
ncbi:MAG: tol-pal system protein YbgF [Desulfobacterales bacterium]